MRAALVSPSQQLSPGDVEAPVEARIPPGSFLSLPAGRNAPLVDPSLLPPGAPALLGAVPGYRPRSPEDTGLPGQCRCWPSRGWRWVSPGLCQPVQSRDMSLWRSVPRVPLLSVITFGSQPPSGWAVAGQPPPIPSDLLPLILDSSFRACTK